MEEVLAEVRTGSRRDAVLYPVGANAAHGLRRINADKRRAVMTLLNDPEWATWSDGEIAKQCGVNQTTVSGYRRSLMENLSEKPAERVYTTKHGTQATMKTTNIGKAKDAAERPATEIPADPAAAAPEPIQAPAKVRPVETTGRAADDAELAALRAENAALRAELDELKASFADTLADNENMGRVIDADDQLKTAMDDNQRLRAVAESAERILRAKSGEFAEAIRTAKYWKNRAEKAEKLLGKAA